MCDTITTAREAAILLIAPSVQYGESLTDIKASFMDFSCDNFSASVGGFIGERWISTKFIVVNRVNGVVINPRIFELKEIYSQVKQMVLAGSFLPGNHIALHYCHPKNNYNQKSL